MLQPNPARFHQAQEQEALQQTLLTALEYSINRLHGMDVYQAGNVHRNNILLCTKLQGEGQRIVERFVLL
ncbi:hypothetical protein D3C80_1865850 [compost metagenome]